MNDNLISFFQQRQDPIPIKSAVDIDRFLTGLFDTPYDVLPIPAKIFLADELEACGYGYAVARSEVLDELDKLLERWISDEILVRTDRNIPKTRTDESLRAYRSAVVRLARNALQSSILADYHAVFWLVHSAQVAHAFGQFPRTALSKSPVLTREQAETLKYVVAARWGETVREMIDEIAEGSTARAAKRMNFVRLLLDNPLIITEEFISPDLRELRTYFAGHLRRDVSTFRQSFDALRSAGNRFMATDPVFRRAILQLGYEEGELPLAALLDRRMQLLISDHPAYTPEGDTTLLESLSRRVMQFMVVYQLRRAVVWMRTAPDGTTLSDDAANPVAYSRGLRPMNFGRRGIVEPIVYRFGLVYDITSFTQTLGEIARSGKEEEQTTYRQMLDFQRELAEVTQRHGLSFEKFLGDGAFYTSRRASRVLSAAVDIQRFYARSKAKGFAFNKGMRIALNYGYYRLLPMQVTADGTEIKEFYGPGIVELSRLTTGKATKEIEDIQHLLLSHGYDQEDVYRFFAPLARAGASTDATAADREFYAYVDQNQHLVNEGIVASIPFLQQLSAELQQDEQRIYRLRLPWSNYLGIPASEPGVYIGIRILGSVSLKGIGNIDVAEVVSINGEDAEVSVLDESKPFVQLLEQERHRRTAMGVNVDVVSGATDLVVCQSLESTPVILVGEWDPVTEEVRRPIQLDEQEAERFGLQVPITADSIEAQSVAFQKLYRTLSRIEALPSFSVQAIRANANYNGFILGQTVERL